MSEQEIQDILLELKEKAELMLNLAYSSLIYDNRKLAEEVYELEEFIDALNDELKKLAINDATTKLLETNEVLAILQLGSFSEAIADAARYIADVELRDVELHPIIRESVMESDEVFVRVEVADNSSLVDKTLGDMQLASETGMWIICIRRDSKWVYDPDKNVFIRRGDILFAKGAREGMNNFIALSGGAEKNI